MSGPVNLHDVPGSIARSNCVLATALGQWARRDDSKAQPEVTRAGHAAVEAIDAMLAELHRARQQLVAEIRQAQDAAAARVDAMLARLRHERPGGRP
jgi:hypothetical protein